MKTEEKYRLIQRTISTKEHFFCKELTLYFVIQNSLTLDAEGKKSSVKEGELLLVNSGNAVTLSPNQDKACQFIELSVDSLFFTSHFPQFFYTQFECQPSQNKTGKMQTISVLRKQVSELCLAHYIQEPFNTLKVGLALQQIILSLVQSFQKEQYRDKHSSRNNKLLDILTYIEDNYRTDFTLNDVSNEFFMSPAALSKLFKKETGEYFSTYVSKVRIQHSLTELLYSKKSIEEIALSNGFSSTKTYRQHMKKQLNESPTNYRKNHSEKNTQQTKTSKKKAIKELSSKDLLITLYSYAQLSSEESSTTEINHQDKTLNISVNDEENYCKNSEIIIHIGTLENLSNQRIQQEITEVNKKMSIKYIGIQSLFAEIPSTYRVHQTEQLNSFPAYEKLDLILDFLEREGLHLFYEFTLSTYQSLDYAKKLARVNFLRHVQSKYGPKMMDYWKINCRFTDNDPEDVYENFVDIYRVCQSINSNMQVGAEIPLPDPYFEYNALQNKTFFAEKIVPKCDFLSYSAEPNYVFRNPKQEFPDLEKYHQYVSDKTNYIKKALHELHVDLPLYLTEWNTLTGVNRSINGTFFRGAIILKEILKLNNTVTGYGFWLNIDLFEDNRKDIGLKNDSLELYHYYSAKRPAYFCLEFTRRLKGKILSHGEDYILTDYNGGYQLLVWNSNYFDPHLSSEESFLQSYTTAYSIEIKDIQNNNYQVKEIDFNRHNGALFYSYEEFSGAKSLDYETQQYVSSITQPKIKVFDTYVEDGFHYYTSLDTNAIVLIELNPITFDY